MKNSKSTGVTFAAPLPDADMSGKPTSHDSRQVTKIARSGETFVWKGAPDYKNERLAYYQKQLANRGITNADHVKLLVAQLIQENGSLSESVHGDNGCSVGVLQYNACVHHGMKAKPFLEKHPEWKSWQYQLDRMADMVAERYEMYHGDIKRVVVHHNRPATARAGNSDTSAGYFKVVSSRLTLLSL